MPFNIPKLDLNLPLIAGKFFFLQGRRFYPGDLVHWNKVKVSPRAVQKMFNSRQLTHPTEEVLQHLEEIGIAKDVIQKAANAMLAGQIPEGDGLGQIEEAVITMETALDALTDTPPTDPAPLVGDGILSDAEAPLLNPGDSLTLAPEHLEALDAAKTPEEADAVIAAAQAAEDTQKTPPGAACELETLHQDPSSPDSPAEAPPAGEDEPKE